VIQATDRLHALRLRHLPQKTFYVDGAQAVDAVLQVTEAAAVLAAGTIELVTGFDAAAVLAETAALEIEAAAALVGLAAGTAEQ
jgi:hypothetical protein